jgi:hypothetical protein
MSFLTTVHPLTKYFNWFSKGQVVEGGWRKGWTLLGNWLGMDSVMGLGWEWAWLGRDLFCAWLRSGSVIGLLGMEADWKWLKIDTYLGLAAKELCLRISSGNFMPSGMSLKGLNSQHRGRFLTWDWMKKDLCWDKLN